jgi:hypothetical protein
MKMKEIVIESPRQFSYQLGKLLAEEIGRKPSLEFFSGFDTVWDHDLRSVGHVSRKDVKRYTDRDIKHAYGWKKPKGILDLANRHDNDDCGQLERDLAQAEFVHELALIQARKWDKSHISKEQKQRQHISQWLQANRGVQEILWEIQDTDYVPRLLELVGRNGIGTLGYEMSRDDPFRGLDRDSNGAVIRLFHYLVPEPQIAKKDIGNLVLSICYDECKLRYDSVYPVDIELTGSLDGITEKGKEKWLGIFPISVLGSVDARLTIKRGPNLLTGGNTGLEISGYETDVRVGICPLTDQEVKYSVYIDGDTSTSFDQHLRQVLEQNYSEIFKSKNHGCYKIDKR